MAKKANKQVQKPLAARKARPQPQSRRVADLPRMSNLRLSQLPGPLSFRLAGGRLKDGA